MWTGTRLWRQAGGTVDRCIRMYEIINKEKKKKRKEHTTLRNGALHPDTVRY